MNILVGVTGSIAAYRSPDFVKELVARGHSVRVLLTKSAAELVSARVLETFSGQSLGDETPEGELAAWAQVICVYAGTADFLSRYARGFPADRLTTELLYFAGPVVVAAAMNPAMWEHAATQENVAILARRGVYFAGPISGVVACGESGVGHIATHAEIHAAIAESMASRNTQSLLAGKRVLVSAGPMRSAIDPVRNVQNRSSGRMGLEFARAARTAGAQVEVILGPVDSAMAKDFEEFQVHRYTSPSEYGALLDECFERCDVFFSLAAVLDFELLPAERKLERAVLGASPELRLPVCPVRDFVAHVAQKKKPHQTIVAFAAETGTDDEILVRAQAKMIKKGADAIVANPVSDEFGPESARNKMWLLREGNEAVCFGPADKSELAAPVILELFKNEN